jgi:hypothetical protein
LRIPHTHGAGGKRQFTLVGTKGFGETEGMPLSGELQAIVDRLNRDNARHAHRMVDIIGLDELRPRIRERVLAEGVVLYEKNHGISACRDATAGL